MTSLVFDIEGDLIPTTKVYAIGIENDVYTQYPVTGSNGPLVVADTLLEKADELIGHNIINYDIPVLRRLRELD